jgi:DNA-binding PadR family transcriptional regulator
MNKRSYKDLILVLIHTKVRTNWYQIERSLDLRGIGGRSNSIKLINELIEEKLVEEQNDPEENLSMYLITVKGQEKVKSLLDQFGVEAFAPTEQNPDDYEA